MRKNDQDHGQGRHDYGAWQSLPSIYSANIMRMFPKFAHAQKAEKTFKNVGVDLITCLPRLRWYCDKRPVFDLRLIGYIGTVIFDIKKH